MPRLWRTRETGKRKSAAAGAAAPSAAVPTGEEDSVTGRVEDLLAAMRQLNLPIGEQISILHQIHRAGALHAEMVVD